MARALLTLLAAVLVGCTSTSFEFTAPITATVTGDKPVDFDADPLKYQFVAVDGRLVVTIFNPTDDTINLVGADSSVVDPDGRSHPVVSQTIAGHSFVKLSLPPPRPWGSGGPVGVRLVVSDYPNGARYGYADAGPPPVAEPDISGDPYAGPAYWDWSGNTPPVRVRLVFRRNDSPFFQQFTIRKIDR